MEETIFFFFKKREKKKEIREQETLPFLLASDLVTPVRSTRPTGRKKEEKKNLQEYNLVCVFWNVYRYILFWAVRHKSINKFQ